MPRSIAYRPALIDELITNERLASYQAVFKPADDIGLVGAYLWNLHACSALYPLLSAVEVTLRNAVDCALSPSLGHFWWKKGKLHYKSYTSNGQPPFEVGAVQKNFSVAAGQVKRDKKQRYGIPAAIPTHHEVIAKTEFSTWEFILDQEFRGPGLIWPTHLGKVFKGRWPTAKSTILLSSTKDTVKAVREFRNRVSHHEPAWKRYGVTNEHDAVAHLHEKIKKTEELIALISPIKLELLAKNGILDQAYRACSIAELRRCQHSVEPHSVSGMTKLCRLVKQAHDTNTPVNVKVYKMGRMEFLIQPVGAS